jgi:hypothetical protein
LNDGLESVRAVLGPQEESGLEDSVIKDALWNEYFDVEKAIQWLLGMSCFDMTRSLHLTSSAEERERRQAAAERKGETLASFR